MTMEHYYQGEGAPIVVADPIKEPVCNNRRSNRDILNSTVGNPYKDEAIFDTDDVVIVDASCWNEMELASRRAEQSYLRQRHDAVPLSGFRAPIASYATPIILNAGTTNSSFPAVTAATSAPSSTMMRTSTRPDRHATMWSAGVTTAACGLLIGGGPVVALVFGVGAAYATQRNGALGDSARAVGQVALHAKRKVAEISEKHHIVERSRNAALTGWEMVKEIEYENRYWGKAMDWLNGAWNATKKAVKPKSVINSGTKGVGKVVGWMSKALARVGNAFRFEENSSSHEKLHAVHTGLGSPSFEDVEPLPPFYNYSNDPYHED